MCTFLTTFNSYFSARKHESEKKKNELYREPSKSSECENIRFSQNALAKG